MARHLFLTGEIQIGKSTAIQRFLEQSGTAADGFITRFDTRSETRRLCLYRFDTTAGERDGQVVAEISESQFRVLSDVFATYGAEIVRSSGASGLIIMDELGVFEERAPAFTSAVLDKLDGETTILGVVKKKVSPFLDAVRTHKNVEVLTVTEQNRDAMPDMIAATLSKRTLLG